jgi:hypothetical protein
MGEPDLEKWRNSGDRFRIAQDINNSPTSASSDPSTMVSWFAVQRAVEAMRIYISVDSVQVTIDRALKGYLDLDAMIIANTGELNMISSAQRRTYFRFWIICHLWCSNLQPG